MGPCIAPVISKETHIRAYLKVLVCRSGAEAEATGWQEVDTRPTAEELEKQQAKEAEHLRQKALTALKSIDRTKDFDAPEEEPSPRLDPGDSSIHLFAPAPEDS